MQNDQSEMPTLSHSAARQFGIPESLLPRPESPSAISGFTHVPRPLHTDMLIACHLPQGYVDVIGEIAKGALEEQYEPLKQSIHRLTGLHAGNENCVVMNECLESLCRDGLIEEMITVEFIFKYKQLTTKLDGEARGILDMCGFLYYAPLVKKDIEQLPDGSQKDLLMRLYRSICPSGHTK
ncbi:hypothetical protein N7456_007432 [Penicillium angulare]|uniref:Uncharacterized protein n=1 Tax=Penicillium angulare TaxID=116970 RepID=A0A9W9FAK8_9EURO|nr:hypothetical protein N7456_007432 [Penicillium angulare]